MKSGSYFRTWLAYQRAFTVSVDIYRLTQGWDKLERYRLVDQIVRSTRSVCSNLGEAYGKRMYVKHFKSKITDAISENYESQVWLDTALSLNCIDRDTYNEYVQRCEEVGKLLYYMYNNPGQYTKKR